MSNSATRAGVKKWFTAMPLYQGRLCDILPLEIFAIEEVMLQLFDAVNYMHRQGVLHKDIKPENILVKGKLRPHVVLADYGICASLNNQDELMAPSGTRGFAAPEVSRMVVQTSAVDVFALGATFFIMLEPEMCKGRRATVATLDNVTLRPPKVYGGLVQSMMAYDPEERPSLKDCFDIVQARQRDWEKRAPLALAPSPVSSPSGSRCSQRLQTAMVQEPHVPDLARVMDCKPRPAPTPRQQQAPARLGFKVRDQVGTVEEPKTTISPIASAPKHQAPAPGLQTGLSVPPHQFPVGDDYKRHQDIVLPKEPQAHFPPAVAKASKAREPTPVQGVNFQDGLPSYQEATGKNPFARLVDSLEIAKKRHGSKLNPPQNIVGPTAEQCAKAVPRKSKKLINKNTSFSGVPPMSPIEYAIHPRVSVTNRRGFASHSPSTTKSRDQHPRNSRQTIRRPREHAQALNIRRTGTGRIRKTTLTGIKAGAVEMGKGLYHFGRGLGAATCNIGCLTAEGIMMLYDLATRKPLAPTAGLLLNDDETQLVVDMRARSLRREAERQRPTNLYTDEGLEDVQRMASRGESGLRRLREGRRLEWR